MRARIYLDEQKRVNGHFILWYMALSKMLIAVDSVLKFLHGKDFVVYNTDKKRFVRKVQA